MADKALNKGDRIMAKKLAFTREDYQKMLDSKLTNNPNAQLKQTFLAKLRARGIIGGNGQSKQ